MDTDNDKYWRKRVEDAEAEKDYWKSLVVKYTNASEQGIKTEAVHYYNKMLIAVEESSANYGSIIS